MFLENLICFGVIILSLFFFFFFFFFVAKSNLVRLAENEIDFYGSNLFELYFLLQLPFIKGLEMIKLFKNHTLKTSLLDDFIYYENRQKIMQEEKARLVVRRLERPYFVPALDQTRQLNCVVEQPLREDKNLNKANDGARGSERNATSRAEQVYSNPGTVAVKESPKLDGEEKADVTSTLRMESLELGGKVVEKTSGGGATPAAASDTNSKPTEVMTVGSMPIKVNGYNTETRGVLTVGTIPLDPKALQLDNK